MLATDFHFMIEEFLYYIGKENHNANLSVSNMPYLFLNFVKICGFL